SIRIGCELSGVFRGIATIAGGLPEEAAESCSPSPLAVWQVHGTADEMVRIADGERARDAFVAGNQCAATKHTLVPRGCVSYDGCDAGYAVVWCAYDGGHTIPSFASDIIGAFFEQL